MELCRTDELPGLSILRPTCLSCGSVQFCFRGTPISRAGLFPLEKVRPRFLSLRHLYSAPRFLHRWMGRKSPANWGISIAATVLEIAELRHFSLGDGIFLPSFVPCGFSIVSKSEVPEGQLETKFAPGSNPGWMSERN